MDHVYNLIRFSLLYQLLSKLGTFIPYIAKLSREKTFAEWVENDHIQENMIEATQRTTDC